MKSMGFIGELFLVVLLISTPAFSHTFQTDTVDAEADIAPNGSDIALDVQGQPGVCYRDQANNLLKYAQFDGENWNRETADDDGGSGDEIGWHCALVFDQLNQPHIVHYDFTEGKLRHAVKIGAGWVRRTIDDDVGTDILTAQRLSAALSPNGQIGVAYHDAFDRDVRYAVFDGADWTSETVVSAGNAGRAVSLAYDSQGRAAIAYQLYIAAANARINYVQETDMAWSEAELVAANGESGKYLSLAFDKNDVPHLAYQEMDPAGIQYQRYINRTGGSWADAITLDSGAAPGVGVGEYTSLVVGPRGNAHIAYKYHFASALFGHAFHIKLASLYFVDQGDRNLILSSSQSLAANSNNNYYAALSLALDDNDNLAVSWATEVAINSYVLNSARITAWSPVVLPLTPTNDDNSATTTFTARWLDFDPDSNAKIRFSFLDNNYTVIADSNTVNEDGDNVANLNVEAMPRGEFSVLATISDDDFQNYAGAMAADRLILEAVAEDNVENENPVGAEVEAEQAGAEDAGQNNVQVQNADSGQGDDAGISADDNGNDGQSPEAEEEDNADAGDDAVGNDAAAADEPANSPGNAVADLPAGCALIGTDCHQNSAAVLLPILIALLAIAGLRQRQARC